MINEPQSESAQEVDIAQSAPARAWADTWRFRSTRPFWLMQLLVPMLVGLAVLVLSVPQVMAIIFPVAALATIPLLSGLFFLLTAPRKQRDEAREELTGVHEQLRPKLRITKVNKSFDSDWQLQDAMIDIESLRVTITNDSKAKVPDCNVSLLGLLPRIRRIPRTLGNVTRYTPNAFDGYPDVPFPIELAWADHVPGQMPTKKDILPLGDAQMSVLTNTSGGSDPGLTIAFSSKEQGAQYRMPTTEVVLALRVNSDSSLPYYYVIRYFPGKIDWPGDTSFEILDEGTNSPCLEQFRIEEETKA